MLRRSACCAAALPHRRRLRFVAAVIIVVALTLASLAATSSDPTAPPLPAAALNGLEAQALALGRLLSPLDGALPDATRRAIGGGSELAAWVEGSARVFRLSARTPQGRLRALEEALAAVTAALERAQATARAGEGAVEAAGSLGAALAQPCPVASPCPLAPPSTRAPSPCAPCPLAPSSTRAPSPCGTAAAAAAPESRVLPGGGLSGYDRSPQRAGQAWFATYGDDAYARNRARLAREAASYAGVFDHVVAWDRGSLAPAWAAAHRAVLAARRGGGYWVWKPHLLLRLLDERMADGDVLLYADAGCTLVADPSPYLALAAQHGLVLFRSAHPVLAWTKGFAFAAAGEDMANYETAGQVVGGVVALQKRPWVRALLREWERLMTADPRVVNDDNTSALVANHPSFREHRHDQSVLTLLAYKHGVFMAPYRSWPKERALIVAATRGHG